jgi:hypothetical protein
MEYILNIRARVSLISSLRTKRCEYDLRGEPLFVRNSELFLGRWMPMSLSSCPGL